jgi:hypothetical protein
MTAIVTSTEVDRPAADVFAYATDLPASASGSRVSWTDIWRVPPMRPDRRPWAPSA